MARIVMATISIACLAGSIAIYAASFCRIVSTAPTRVVQLDRGCLSWHNTPIEDTHGWRVEAGHSWASERILPRFASRPNSNVWVVVIPLWIPVFVAFSCSWLASGPLHLPCFPEKFWLWLNTTVPWLQPELALFDCSKDKAQALTQAYPTQVASYPLAALVVLYVFACSPYLRSHVISRGQHFLLLFSAVEILILLGLLTVFFVRIRENSRNELRKLLRARGILLCTTCGYDLRGLTALQCPECGSLVGC